jgi:hypothetical protein
VHLEPLLEGRRGRRDVFETLVKSVDELDGGWIKRRVKNQQSNPLAEDLHRRTSGKVGWRAGLVVLHDRQPLLPRDVVAGWRCLAGLEYLIWSQSR